MKSLAWALLCGFLIRLLLLSVYPPGFTPDEAAFGYNAYSLLLTGKDEWGVPLEGLFFTNLRSFGDYKLPLYAILTVPTVAAFGLNHFSVRLPAVMCGTLGIVAIFLLARRLFPKYPEAAGWAAWLMALSPWYLPLTRGAFEASLPLLFIPLSWAAWKANKPYLAVLALVPAWYAYHSARYFLFLLLPLVWLRSASRRHSAWLLLVLLLLPGMVALIGSGASRAADIGLFHPTDNWVSVVNRRGQGVNVGLPDAISRIFSNRPLTLLSQALANFTSYFSPEFLFISGARETTYGMLPGRGVLYLVQLPLIIIALGKLWTSRRNLLLVLIGLALVSVLPAAWTKGGIAAANRAALLLPWLTLLSAYGIARINRKRLHFAMAVYLAIAFVFWAEAYFFHSPFQSADGMLYGRGQAVFLATGLRSSNSVMYFSRSLSEPHIFYAFYTAYPPADYQKQAASWPTLISKHVSFLDQIDGLTLTPAYFGSLPSLNTVPPGTVLVGLPQDFSTSVRPHRVILNPAGKPIIWVVISGT